MHSSLTKNISEFKNRKEFGGLYQYQNALTDPVQREFMRIQFNCDSHAQLIQKLCDREEGARAHFEFDDFVEFEDFVESSTDFSKQKKRAEELGLQVLKTRGFKQRWNEEKKVNVRTKVNFYNFTDSQTKYSIYFMFDDDGKCMLDNEPVWTIHIMLIQAAMESQGNYFSMSKLLKQFKAIFLDSTNLPFAWGRSMADNRFDIKPTKDGRNWRKQIRPIKNYVTGEYDDSGADKLASLYKRAGFVEPHPNTEQHPVIYLLSDTYKKRFSENEGRKKWLKEMLKFKRNEKYKITLSRRGG